MTTGDTRRFGYAVGTFASRAAVMSGNAVALAARAVRAKALRIAADALEVDPDDLEIVDGVVAGEGQPGGVASRWRTVAVLSNPLRYAFDEAAKAATQFARPADPDKPPVADGRRAGPGGTRLLLADPRRRSPPACTPRSSRSTRTTSEISIVQYCVVHDCGTLINPMIVEGQVHGGVAQGVGGALYETHGLRRATGSCSTPRSWTS